MFHLLKMTNHERRRRKISIIAKTCPGWCERARTSTVHAVVKDRRRTQGLGSSGLRHDSSPSLKQRGHGRVNTRARTHSYTLTHNLLVTRAGFHDNRQAEGERKKKEREQNPARLSQNVKSHVRMIYYQTHETKK